MSITPPPSLGDQAKDALGRHAWREAFDLLAGADARGALTPAELALLAEAAWWTGQLPLAIDVRERAYAAATKANDLETAVTVAIFLGRDHLYRNRVSVATAWLNRAERLLEGTEEGRGHGWLAATRAFHDALTGATDASLAQAERAIGIARRIEDRDLEALATAEKGAALVTLGRLDEGLALIDEATVAAVGGELDAGTAGGVCCTTIEACASLGQWGRAVEWTEAQDRWCAREGINGYPGMCRLFRSEVKLLRGAWLDAEAEARRAADELASFVPAGVGAALYRLGEIKLLRGDLPAAEEMLIRAHGFGRDPEPALSLLRLAQGKVDVATALIRHALEAPEKPPSWRAQPDSRLWRFGLLPAQVEIALAGGDLATARAAADELMALVDVYRNATFGATAAAARGAVLTAEGHPAEAARALHDAVRLWAEVDAPYPGARARLALAEALFADGQPEAAGMELDAAHATFERLGATLDLRRAEATRAALSGGGDGRRTPTSPVRAVRAFMFTDIVDSTRLTELLGDDAWNRLIRWHDEALRAVVAEYGGEEIKRTGDGFFLAFVDSSAAVACAIAIQRRLAEQREAQGFALSVRIGIHGAEARQTGLDYIGAGVNRAARIAAEAEGAEILVSAETLAAIPHPVSEAGRRSLALKGISEPVEVVAVDWR